MEQTDIEEIYRQSWAAKTFAERYQRVSELFSTAQRIAGASVDRLYPGISARERQLRIAEIIYWDCPETLEMIKQLYLKETTKD